MRSTTSGGETQLGWGATVVQSWGWLVLFNCSTELSFHEERLFITPPLGWAHLERDKVGICLKKRKRRQWKERGLPVSLLPCFLLHAYYFHLAVGGRHVDLALEMSVFLARQRRLHVTWNKRESGSHTGEGKRGPLEYQAFLRDRREHSDGKTAALQGGLTTQTVELSTTKVDSRSIRSILPWGDGAQWGTSRL